MRSAASIGTWQQDADTVLQQLQEAAAPKAPFPILANQELNGKVVSVSRRAAARTVDLKQRILSKLPKAVFQTGDKGYKLKDVKEGRVSMDAFMAQLSLEDLEDAMIHPEKHQNIVVKVTGYSAHFVQLDKSFQQEIINRTRHTKM